MNQADTVAICEVCRQPIQKEALLIIFSEAEYNVVKALKLVHHFSCDDNRFNCSMGAAFGPDWDVQEHIRRFRQKTYLNPSDREKVLTALTSAYPTNYALSASLMGRSFR